MRQTKIEYQPLSHKADTGFRLEAPSLQRLYINAALALTDLRVPLDIIKDGDKKTVKVTGEDKESLMVKWLNEILFLFEKEKFLCRRVVFEKFDGKQIEASLWGETYDHIRHGTISEIKAVTYHQLSLGQTDGPDFQFFARIFLDL